MSNERMKRVVGCRHDFAVWTGFKHPSSLMIQQLVSLRHKFQCICIFCADFGGKSRILHNECKHDKCVKWSRKHIVSPYACCCLYTGCTGITGWLFLSDDVSFIHDLNPDAE